MHKSLVEQAATSGHFIGGLRPCKLVISLSNDLVGRSLQPLGNPVFVAVISAAILLKQTTMAGDKCHLVINRWRSN